MTIWQEAEALKEELITRRRDLHKHPETGWTEFRTASIVIQELQALGYEVHYGSEIIDEASMMGLPKPEVLEGCMQRAISEGADPKLVQAMAGGKTGVLAILRTNRPGKTVAFRFDMDSNDAEETQDAEHRPNQEGFASQHKLAMHACGHDGHTAIGLGTAKLLMQHKNELSGTVKLIFQPAEEGVRGAYAMVNAGIVDDVDYMFGGHLGFKNTVDNTLAAMTGGFLATTKLDVKFKGVSAHAGANPEEGKNALLAAAQAAISLSTISRHSKGSSRINVGTLNAGTGRNVVPDIAELKLETRGLTTEIDQYMAAEATRMLKACAALYDVEVSISVAGKAPAIAEDPELAQEITALMQDKCHYKSIFPYADIGCSEDCGYFMERVQNHGGHASYLMYGTPICAVHHNNHFDFKEDALWRAAAALTEMAIHFTQK